MKRKNAVQRRAMKASAYEVDIAQEFKDVKTEISGLKKEIFAWRNTVDNQLTKLNSNMESVLKTISNHEFRLSELEKQKTEDNTRIKTISEMSKFGWFAAKLVFTAGTIVGSIFSGTAILKMIFER